MKSYLQMLKENLPGDKIILSDGRQECSIDDLNTRCQILNEQLQARNIKILGLYADNGIDWIVADFVCQMAVITLLPLPGFFSNSQISHVLKSCKIDAILTDSPAIMEELLNEQQGEQIEKIEVVKNSGLSLLTLISENNTPQLPAGTGKVTFTSGSTGTPKGVCLSNEQLQLQAMRLSKAVGLKSPKHLCVLPLSTLLENVAGVYAPLIAQGELIIPKLGDIGFKGSTLVDQNKFLAMISHVNPDSMILIPQLLLLLVAVAQSGWKPPKSLKFVAVGGSKVSKELILKANSLGIPVFEGYGLSECASVVSLNTPLKNKPGSCGKPLPNLEISVEDGEILVSGNSMLGYVNEPESWRQDVIKTGDLGYLDKEGFLQIDGRKKNLLISSYGRNISPEWLESEILANPQVAEAVVFGDAKAYCSALIFARSTDTSNIEIQNWLDIVNATLPDYARIVHWHRLPSPMSQEKQLMTEYGRPRRENIMLKFKEEIAALYRNEQYHKAYSCTATL